MNCPSCHQEISGPGPCWSCGMSVERPSTATGANRPTLISSSLREPHFFCSQCGTANPCSHRACVACGSPSPEHRQCAAGLAALLVATAALLGGFLGWRLLNPPAPVQPEAAVIEVPVVQPVTTIRTAVYAAPDRCEFTEISSSPSGATVFFHRETIQTAPGASAPGAPAPAEATTIMAGPDGASISTSTSGADGAASSEVSVGALAPDAAAAGEASNNASTGDGAQAGAGADGSSGIQYTAGNNTRYTLRTQ